MKGVITPPTSAGSNQVGASDMCVPQTSRRLGLSAAEPALLASMRSVAAAASTLRRVISGVAPPRSVHRLSGADEHMAPVCRTHSLLPRPTGNCATYGAAVQKCQLDSLVTVGF